MRDARGTTQAAVALALAALLLGLATAAGPMFVSSVASSMLADELDTGDTHRSMLTVITSGWPVADQVRDADRELGATLSAHGLPVPQTGVVIALSSADGLALNLIGRSGSALDELPTVRTPADGEVAVDVRSAAGLGIEPGTPLAVTDGVGPPIEIQVGDLIEDFDRHAMPAAWRTVSALLTVVDDPRIAPPPPALVTGTDQALGILDRVAGHDAVAGTGANTQVTWAVDAPRELTFEEAGRLLPRLEDVRRDLADPTSAAGSMITGDPFGVPLVGGAEFDAAVGRVTSAVDELAVPVALLTMTGQLLALGGLSVAVVLGGRRRLARAQLWNVRGVSAASLGLRWAVGSLLPLALGLAAGWALAVALVQMLGPAARLDDAARTAAALPLIVACGAAAILVGLVAAITVRLRTRPVARPRRTPPIAEIAAVALAAVTVWQVDARGGVVTTSPDGTLQLDPLAVALPITLVVAVCAAGVRILGGILRLVGRRRARLPGWFLASRRLRSFGGATMGLTFLTATAAGLLALSTTLHRSSEATVDEKIGLTVGADAVLPLSRSTVSEPPDPDSFPVPTTRVRRAPDALADGAAVELLAIDPATFADVAYEPRYLGEVDVAGLASRLHAPPAGETRPAIMVGGGGFPLGTSTSVQVADLELAIEPIAHTPIFPGASDDGTTIVIADGGELDPDDAATTARLAVAIHPELWFSRDGLDETSLRSQLSLAQLPGGGIGPGAAGPTQISYTADLSGDPRVASAAWTFAFLRGQSALIAIIAFLGLLAHHVARRREAAFGSAIAARMGLRRRARFLAEAIELAGVTALALALGVGGGIAAARTVAASYDPVPEIALPVVFHLPSDALSVPVLVAAVCVVITIFLTVRVVDRVPIGRLLRSGA